MPRNGSGTYALPAGNPVVTDTTIDASWANDTMNDMVVQLNNVLTRDGLLGITTTLMLRPGVGANAGVSFEGYSTYGIYLDIDNLNFDINVAGVTVMAVFVDDVTFTVGLTLGSTLDVAGAVDMSTTLNVTGGTTLGSAIVGTTLGVTGATTLGSTLNVTGNTTLSSADINFTLNVLGTIFTNKVSPNNGTAAAPTIMFANDSTSGMFSNAISSLSWSIAGTEHMRLTLSGLNLYPGKKLRFDGVSGTGDTYIEESSSNVLDMYSGGTRSLRLSGATVSDSSDTVLTPVGQPVLAGISATRTTAGAFTTYALNTGSGGGFVEATGIYTAPYTGYYSVAGSFSSTYVFGSDGVVVVSLRKDSVAYANFYGAFTDAGRESVPIASTIYLTAGQTLDMYGTTLPSSRTTCIESLNIFQIKRTV